MVPLSGYAGASHAFVPAPLPPRWGWPQSLWPALMTARIAIAGLDGTGKHLPNPELLLRPLQSREAERSSKLEGTYTEPDQQALFELDPQVPMAADTPVNARREVSNYARALRLRRTDAGARPLSLHLVRELHAVLMDGVRGSDRDPGRFRSAQNQIGRPAHYVPPPPHLLAEQLDNLEAYLCTPPAAIDPLVAAFIAHYQFEAIHPFMDGNGRVGRLLLAVSIEEWCGLSGQWLYMSAYFEKRRDEYLHRLFRVSTHGEWTEWVGFCLEGAAEQAHDALARCERLLSLHGEFHEKLRHTPGDAKLLGIVDDLFKNPAIRVTDVAQRIGVTYPTARRYLSRLANLGILRELPGAATISFVCPSILDVTFAD